VSSDEDLLRRDRWSRLRFAIIGPLLAAPPAPGDLQAALNELAARPWRHPLTGLEVRFGASTIQRWFYVARAATNPMEVLRNQIRSDIGSFPSVCAQAAEALRTLYDQHSSWTAKLLHDNLQVVLAEADPPVQCPSYPSVRRYLKAHGLTRKRPERRGVDQILNASTLPTEREIRSYEVPYVLQLLHLDFHEGSRKILTRTGERITPLLVAFIDDHSRFMAHAQWYTSEGTEQLVHGFCQALSKVGLPRSLMNDRGSAMMSGEFTAGLAALGIVHVPTRPKSPHVNGKQESWWSQIEGRLLPMLEGEPNLTLDQLNLATLAWVTQEYNRTKHEEIGCPPLERYLAAPNVARECPGSEALRAAFRIEVKRRQRRSDGTVRLENQRFEIPSRYRHLSDIRLRYARWDLSRVDLIDPHSGAILCPVYPIDKVANAEGLRRVLEPVSHSPKPAACGIAPLLKKMIADYAATGLPPAYLPESNTQDDPT
jgi:transposase InsO family protein